MLRSGMANASPREGPRVQRLLGGAISSSFGAGGSCWPWCSPWRWPREVLDLVVHPLMARPSATALWAQVIAEGDRKSPKRMMAVGSLARELELVLHGIQDLPWTDRYHQQRQRPIYRE